MFILNCHQDCECVPNIRLVWCQERDKIPNPLFDFNVVIGIFKLTQQTNRASSIIPFQNAEIHFERNSLYCILNKSVVSVKHNNVIVMTIKHIIVLLSYNQSEQHYENGVISPKLNIHS